MAGFYVFKRLIDITYSIGLFEYDIRDEEDNTRFIFDNKRVALEVCRELNNE